MATITTEVSVDGALERGSWNLQCPAILVDRIVLATQQSGLMCIDYVN